MRDRAEHVGLLVADSAEELRDVRVAAEVGIEGQPGRVVRKDEDHVRVGTRGLEALHLCTRDSAADLVSDPFRSVT